jgi:AcrR family transcriptional regulator
MLPPMPRKHETVLDAAVGLFLRHGYRKASMNDIAREAGVSKPTLYALFDDKEALFAAVCAHLGRKMLAEAEAGAAGATAVDRVSAILSAKFTTTFELLRRSPHAQELMDTQQALARKRIDETTERFEALLLAEIGRASRSGELRPRRLGLDKRALVRLLMQAGYGASYGAATAEEQKRQLRALVRTLLR